MENTKIILRGDYVKKIDVVDLTDGAILARPVVNDNGLILLYEGAEIKPEHITKLLDNNITTVFIQDTPENLKVDDYTVADIQKESVSKIRLAVENKIREDDDEELVKLTETAGKIIEDIVSNPEITDCMLNVKRKSTDIYEHMLNVASLSTIMGIKLGFDEEALRNIATGALLHDIGLCDVGVPYENTEMDRMPAADKLNYRKHVIQGYEILQKYKWMNDVTKAIVLSHHEKMDGSGYPFHKIGERIPEEVRLVAICDSFDELTNGIGYKKRKVHEVVEFFRTSGTYLYDYDILSRVIVNIAWFPTGSRVVTNEGEIASIVKQNKSFPDRPIIKVIKKADGTACTDETVKDLTELLTVFIVDTVE